MDLKSILSPWLNPNMTPPVKAASLHQRRLATYIVFEFMMELVDFSSRLDELATVNTGKGNGEAIAGTFCKSGTKVLLSTTLIALKD
ncbi:hypothetical protein VNI00_017858 [Paramarasmius palmivorus]|uniref:Uncharacterized protein n=1 Tax=Paramarasmius palmivorus TaxID=297713 RepID=A0AAW0B2E1_9AGAR